MFSLTIRTTKMHSWGQQKQNGKQFLYIQMCYLWGVRLCALTDMYAVCRHTNSKSKCFKSLNFIMFQFRTMRFSDSGSIKRIKVGKQFGYCHFFPHSPLFSSLPAWWKLLNCRASLAHWENSNTATLLLSHPGLDTLLQLWDCGEREKHGVSVTQSNN